MNLRDAVHAVLIARQTCGTDEEALTEWQAINRPLTSAEKDEVAWRASIEWLKIQRSRNRLRAIRLR